MNFKCKICGGKLDRIYVRVMDNYFHLYCSEVQYQQLMKAIKNVDEWRQELK